MQEHEDHTPEGVEPPADANPGPEAHAPGPEPHGGEEAEELTVDDILNAANDEAHAEGDDATKGDDAATDDAQADDAQADDEANPYLDDLRRLTAEYANYRKRTEANRELDVQRATAKVIEPLLGVLDDFDRAEAHGDLEQGTAFHTIAQKIRTSLERLGLEAFGEKGEPFDPLHHEAIAQVPVPGTEEETVLDVVERGYRIGQVELRPAKVAVAVNADG